MCCSCQRFLLFLVIMLPFISCSNRSDSSVSVVLNSPVLPKNAVSTFELEPGFKIELVASEPLISDPVDMEIDEYGRLYVVEMHGYPLDKTGTGIIKLLSDTDGDGHMDKSTVFADSLTLPNSVMRWKKGVLVTDAPHVFYLEDTNGDGRADKKEIMLTGFALSNPQHNLNSPVLAIDNWIYLAHEGAVATQTYKNEFGDTGTAIYYPQVPASPRLPPNANGRAVRFRPDQHLLETTSGNTQFGHAFDTWGHHFLVANYNHIIQEGFFGQEINHTTYNLARMNMFLHNINYDKFDIALGNTLIDPHFGDEKPFDAIVSNPPYSVNWIGSDDPTLINDDRFAPAGVLAPKSKADFAFVLHALSYLSGRGRAAIVCFPGIFYRGGAEQKIRKYLVDNNFVETIIALPSNLFYGTSISVNILVLSKHKTDTKTQFIDATGEDFFKKVTNNNVLEDKHIKKIMNLFDSKTDEAHIAISIDNVKIAENDHNLSVSSYVEAKDNREKIDIVELNKEVTKIVEKINKLRTDINNIITEIEV